MLKAFEPDGRKLARRPREAEIASALWIDLFNPTDAERNLVLALGVEVPTLSDMEEIEISNRLYHEDKADFMTVVLPGLDFHKEHVAAPVCFILSHERLVTVRHHAPRPFETFPERADKVQSGCSTPVQVFAGLSEEVIGRLADHLEESGREMDKVGRVAFGNREQGLAQTELRAALTVLGTEGERLARVRLGLLTMARALNHFSTAAKSDKRTSDAVKTQLRDIDALQVHSDFLGNRIALTSDMLLGMINLTQNSTSRTASVVAVLFLPPTLIASTYGMNFRFMPELAESWGYPAALIAMLASAALAFGIFKWKGWL